MYNCKFCSRLTESIYSHKSHESRCKENPERTLQGWAQGNNGRIPKKTSCLSCKKEVQNFHFATHKCKNDVPTVTHDLKCPFCQKDNKSNYGFTAHVIVCNKNPESKWFNYEYRHNRHKGPFIWTEEKRKIQSDRMKLAVETFPDAYTGSNRGRVKQIIIDGIKCQGQWEVDFYMWCKNNSINIERCNESFDYEYEGRRKYFPDFYLPDTDTYIEVKGYETDKDRAKWLHFPKKLVIIKAKQIKEIRSNSYSGPEA